MSPAGDLDLVQGGSDGGIRFYENVGSVTEAVFEQREDQANPFDGIDVSYSSTPALGDIDGDGDLDLIAGGHSSAYTGVLNFFENMGSAKAPDLRERTGAGNVLDSVNVGEWSSPAFGDLNGDGALDVVVGRDDGALSFYESVRFSASVVTEFVDRSSGIVANDWQGIGRGLDRLDLGVFSAPALGDLDGDGTLRPCPSIDSQRSHVSCLSQATWTS